jgi:hypothetical protein
MTTNAYTGQSVNEKTGQQSCCIQEISANCSKMRIDISQLFQNENVYQPAVPNENQYQPAVPKRELLSASC